MSDSRTTYIMLKYGDLAEAFLMMCEHQHMGIDNELLTPGDFDMLTLYFTERSFRDRLNDTRTE